MFMGVCALRRKFETCSTHTVVVAFCYQPPFCQLFACHFHASVLFFNLRALRASGVQEIEVRTLALSAEVYEVIVLRFDLTVPCATTNCLASFPAR
jgi:hypothetical protein